MFPLTEALNDSHFDSSQYVASLQCSLCLHDIELPTDETIETVKGYVQCPRCDYHQPITKMPRSRDMVVFGVTIAVVYFATIVGVLLSR